VTWQPDGSASPDPAAAPRLPAEPAQPSEPAQPARPAWRWVATLLVLAVGLVGLAAAAVGAAHQLMPRQFTATQERQIMTWEMARRWRADPAGEIFPLNLTYQQPSPVIAPASNETLGARRLGIGRQGSCEPAVSSSAAQVLAAHGCSVLLRATYLDSSGSMLVTVAVAVLPDTSAATAVASALSPAHAGIALGTLAVRGTAAARFKNRQRQLAYATSEGPYVVLATAGFTDGRPHELLLTDSYYDREMTNLVTGLTNAIATRLGQRPPVPSCPGAPGC
jgi:hypothetical protein